MKDSLDNIHVTLIGSFRKDESKLKSIYAQLNKQFKVISPVSIEFASQEDGFVKTKKEQDESIYDIESRHLQAIANSDLVVLHAPKGYVGLSGSLEIGFAHALGVPVIADELPLDGTIKAMITQIIPDLSSIDIPTVNVGKGVVYLQRYYRRIAKRRGWEDESARDTMLLLTEEIGELARAIRKHHGLKRDSGYDGVLIEDELADVQLYLVHLANTLGLDLATAVTNKEVKNTKRFVQGK